MIFKGYGSIFNPANKKMVVDFQKTPEYETTDAEEIRLIKLSGYVTEESGSMPIVHEPVVESDEKELTKKQVMESLDAMDITYNPRDKKEVLAKLLEA